MIASYFEIPRTLLWSETRSFRERACYYPLVSNVYGLWDGLDAVCSVGFGVALLAVTILINAVATPVIALLSVFWFREEDVKSFFVYTALLGCSGAAKIVSAIPLLVRAMLQQIPLLGNLTLLCYDWRAARARRGTGR